MLSRNHRNRLQPSSFQLRDNLPALGIRRIQVLKNLDSARGGELVAIYEYKRRGRIQVSIVDEK
jgi:hypothetical protein